MSRKHFHPVSCSKQHFISVPLRKPSITQAPLLRSTTMSLPTTIPSAPFRLSPDPSSSAPGPTCQRTSLPTIISTATHHLLFPCYSSSLFHVYLLIATISSTPRTHLSGPPPPGEHRGNWRKKHTTKLLPPRQTEPRSPSHAPSHPVPVSSSFHNRQAPAHSLRRGRPQKAIRKHRSGHATPVAKLLKSLFDYRPYATFSY